MCGIVVYFGDAESRLNRILTGMWAIVYRAPDSTGIGMIGSDLEPMRIRRELGSVDNLIDRLLAAPVFDEGELGFLSMMDNAGLDRSELVTRARKKLLAFEGFLSEDPESAAVENSPPPRWHDLTDTRRVLQVAPGTPGSSELREYHKIDSPRAFKAVIERLVADLDLPLGVVEKLMREGLEEQVGKNRESGVLPVEEEDLFHEFRLIFDSYAHDEDPVRPMRTARLPEQKNPYARKYLWRYLREAVVVVPSDHTVDGIANLFRAIDASVLASCRGPETDDRIQLIFEKFRTRNRVAPGMHWRTLYRAEKSCNVYGIAAASALAFFQTEVYLKNMPGEDELPPGNIPGRTHPLLLKYMTQPLIAQGRWALQSSISVRNAHPFVDQKKLRAVVLNGQFSTEVESRLREYLTRVTRRELRSENSTEYFAMLWEHYFDTTRGESLRFQEIEEQHRLGLGELSVGSRSIDYGLFMTLNNKTENDMDEMSFVRAVEAMIPSGGQFAVCGISIVSPDRLFAATHNRPLYIVKRRDTSDFMVVSDINAALGLFPQSLIRSTGIKLQKLMKAYSKRSVIVEPGFFDDASDTRESWFRREKMALLKPFQVDIHALDQERIFAKIQTRAGTDSVLRELTIRDFSGKIRTDIKPEQTFLTPITFKKDFGKTFYEDHLLEIPGLLTDIMSRYTCPDRHVPKLDIKRRLLERRFGTGLNSLNRIILVSTGFSYLLAEIVEKTMERFLTGINIVVTTPLDMDNVENSINADRDLVVMISWSGTTSDMIDFASRLLRKKILMVGITEKPFSDLALIVRKSAGVVPVLSGEEVTVAALKSAVCMLLTLDLFCLHIGELSSGSTESVAGLLAEMEQLPGELDALLNDEKTVAFCREAARLTSSGDLHHIVDALHDVGSAKMGILNLELNAWTSMGNAVDYSELDDFIGSSPADEDLILVNATHTRRLGGGVRFMAALHKAGKRFFAVSYKNRETDKILNYSESCLLVPKLSDCFQPFIDLPVMFLLGFYFGLARGRLSDQMPRNMAKSVTAGRAKDGKERSVSDLLDDMEVKNRALGLLPGGLPAGGALPRRFQRDDDDPARQYYLDLIRLCGVFHEPDPFSAIFATPADHRLETISTLIFKHLEDDGIIIFVPLDMEAEAACRNFIRLWGVFFPIPLQVEFPEKLRGVGTEDSLLVALSSEPPDRESRSIISRHSHRNLLWIGPDLGEERLPDDSSELGGFLLRDGDLACKQEQHYFALSLFFAKVMDHRFPDRSRRLHAHFKLFLPAVNTLLGDEPLGRSIGTVIRETEGYGKRLFITSLRGNCIFWKNGLRTGSTRRFESETFGVSAYSHLVMVDPSVEEKYVKLEPRAMMVNHYPDGDIRSWEERYLGGISVDAFLRESAMSIEAHSVPPFLYENQWYLPVTKPGYDHSRDCLVVIDAASESHFDSALDELATFGSRYARLVVITQRGFATDARLAALKKFPLSHVILLPGIEDSEDDPGVVSDFILPVLMNITGAMMKGDNSIEFFADRKKPAPAQDRP